MCLQTAVEHLKCRNSAAQNEELTFIAAGVKEIFTSAGREILRYQRTGTGGIQIAISARYYYDDFRVDFL